MNIFKIFYPRSISTFIFILAISFNFSVHAQDYPNKPIRILVGAVAGGPPDILARMVGQALSEQWRQPVIVENKVGATGMIASQELIKAPADGYTLMFNVNGIVSESPHIIPIPFDYFREIRPLVELGRSSLVLVGNTQLPVNNLSALVAYIKANPGKISYASYSNGTISHTAGLQMNKFMNIDMVHLPYRGAPLALQDVMGGSVPLFFAGASSITTLVKNNKLKAFATSSPSRLSKLPDVPTFSELGYSNMTNTIWQGVWVRSSMPVALQNKIREAILSILESPKTKEQLSNMGLEPGTGATPEQLLESLKTASEKHGEMLKSINFKPE